MSRKSSEVAWARLVAAHDALNAIRVQTPDLDGLDDAQTILLMLASSFLKTGDSAREFRHLFAAKARRDLSRKHGEVTLPFGNTLEPHRAANIHAELAAWSIEPLNRESAFSAGEAHALAGFVLDLLRSRTSPLSKHVGAAHPEEPDSLQEKIARALLKEWSAKGSLDGERVVVLALKTSGYPKPENVFSRKDKR